MQYNFFVNSIEFYRDREVILGDIVYTKVKPVSININLPDILEEYIIENKNRKAKLNGLITKICKVLEHEDIHKALCNIKEDVIFHPIEKWLIRNN